MKYRWRTVTKEEIHGGVEVWLHGNQDNKAQVPSQSHEVDPQKQYKEGYLPLWMLWKSPKDETGHHADIPSQGHLSSLRCLQSPKMRFLGQRKSRWRNHFVLSWKHRCPRARRDSGRQMSYLRPMQKSPLQHLLGLSKRLLSPWSDSFVYAEVTGPRRDWHFCIIWIITFTVNVMTLSKEVVNSTWTKYPHFFFSSWSKHCDWINEPLRFILDFFLFWEEMPREVILCFLSS